MRALRQIGFLLAIISTATTVPSQAGDKWEYLQDRSPGQFQSDFNKFTGDGFRPVTVQLSTFNSAPLYNALIIQDDAPFAWMMRSRLTTDDCEKVIETEGRRGYRPISLGASEEGGKPSFAVVLVRDGGRRKWEVRLRSTPASFKSELAMLAKKGLRPESLAAYPASGSARMAALLVEAAGQPFETRVDLTIEAVREFAAEAQKEHRRPIALTAYPSGRKTLFAMTVVDDGASGEVVFDLSREELAREVERRRAGTFGPRAVIPYQSEGSMRVAAIFESPPLELPVTGDAAPELTVFDRAVQGYLAEKHFRGATLAISRGGKLLLSRGYGYLDAEERTPMPPDALMRIASNAKPLTAMCAKKLIRDGKLKPTTKVAEFLDLHAPAGKEMDPHWKDITVHMLLNHRGGWDSGAAIEGFPKGFDPMFAPQLIGKELKIPPPLKPMDFVRYMAGQPLNFKPGEKYVYSNFGYCLLGRVIEKASGMSYGDYLRTAILEPLGATDIKIGRSLPEDRDPREPVYRDRAERPNAIKQSSDDVRMQDGGFVIEALDSHGGLIASAPHLTKVLDAYWMPGDPRNGARGPHWTHTGSLPGTYSVVVQRADGVNIVLNLNERRDYGGGGDEQIIKILNNVADGIRRWPVP